MFKFRLENRANLIADQMDTLHFFSEKIPMQEKCARTHVNETRGIVSSIIPW